MDSRTGTSNRDSRPGPRPLLDEPWFAKLPAELRQAMRADAQKSPPRGYEERLKRYFESIDQ